MALMGLLAGAAYPPVDLWPLALVKMIPLIWAGWRFRPGGAFRAGWVYGLGLVLADGYWLLVVTIVYGHVAWGLAILALFLVMAYVALYMGGFSWLLAWWGGPTPWSLLLAPLAWAGLEFARGQVLTGFPWLPLGQTLHSFPPLIQTAEWWGATGLGFWVMVINALLAWACLPGTRSRRGRVMAAAAAALLLAAATSWGYARMAQVERAAGRAPHLAVTVVQGNFDLVQLWDRANRPSVIERQLKLSASAEVRERPWLAIWPESAAPFYFLHEREFSLPVLEFAGRHQMYITLGSNGVVERGGDVRSTNRAWLIGPEGKPTGFYDKAHLVPFGEYVPWSQVLFFVRALATMGADMAAGVEGGVIRTPDFTLGPLICYESIFPELARKARLAGADLFVNQTNDAWYGRTSAPYQHMSHLVMRAVENRTSAARAANTGVSGFVLPDGRVTGATGIFVPAQSTARLPLTRMSTFYTAHGDLAGPAGLAAAILMVIIGGWKRRRTRRSEDV